MVILKALLSPSAHFSFLRPIQSLVANLLLNTIEAKTNRKEVLEILTHNRAELQKGVTLAVISSVLTLVLGSLFSTSAQTELAGVSCVMMLYGFYLQIKVNWVGYQQRLFTPISLQSALTRAGARSSIKYFMRRCHEEDGVILQAELQAATLLYQQGRIWEPGKVRISRKGLIA